MSTASTAPEAADPAASTSTVAAPGVPGTDRLVDALSRVRFQLSQTQVALDTFMNRVIEQAREAERAPHPETPAALAGHLVALPEAPAAGAGRAPAPQPRPTIVR